ncbi:MAG: ketopantoate reductase family protein [Pigmentiphaga sp.]
MTGTHWRIAIVGAGAIGCRVAAHLAQAGVATTLFDGWAEHVAALNRDGLTLEHQGRETVFPVRAYGLDATSAENFDLVLLAVRSDDTAATLPLVARLLAPDGMVLSCQNGLNEDAIAQAVGASRTLGCSLVLGARLTAPGRVAALPGPDTLRVGELDGSDSNRVRQLADLLGACGTATVTRNLLGYRWMKLVLNSIGNPLLLLSGATAATLHEQEPVRVAMIALAGEILATAAASGAKPEPVLDVPAAIWRAPDARHDDRLHHALREHGRSLGARRLSMVADFEARGRTEVDHINGYVVAKALSLGLAAPLNAEVVRLVKQMEAGEPQASPEALRPLLDLVAKPV